MKHKKILILSLFLIFSLFLTSCDLEGMTCPECVSCQNSFNSCREMCEDLHDSYRSDNYHWCIQEVQSYNLSYRGDFNNIFVDCYDEDWDYDKDMYGFDLNYFCVDRECEDYSLDEQKLLCYNECRGVEI